MADPEGDANALLKHLKRRPLEYGIWLDLEDRSVEEKGKAYIRDLSYIYADIFHQAGYYVGIYSNKDWYTRLIHEDLKRDFDFWFARYPKHDTGIYNKTSPIKPSPQIAVAWQYSSKGNVAGIKTRCDLNVDYDGIVRLIAQAPESKTCEEIALEVLDGLWGNGAQRKELLRNAGYDPKQVQKIVNEIIKERT